MARRVRAGDDNGNGVNEDSNMTETSKLSNEQGMRRWGAALKLWRLCGNASCRRSRACRGDVDCCFAANFPLLPDGVRDFIDGLAEARARALFRGGACLARWHRGVRRLPRLERGGCGLGYGL
jgi:hypothetical protein